VLLSADFELKTVALKKSLQQSHSFPSLEHIPTAYANTKKLTTVTKQYLKEERQPGITKRKNDGSKT
jgi:hypothetical protein